VGGGGEGGEGGGEGGGGVRHLGTKCGAGRRRSRGAG
jgi:hypothetical protein